MDEVKRSKVECQVCRVAYTYDYHGTYWTIMVRTGLSWYVLDYHGTYWTIMVRTGLSWYVLGSHGTYWALIESGQSWKQGIQLLTEF